MMDSMYSITVIDYRGWDKVCPFSGVIHVHRRELS